MIVIFRGGGAKGRQGTYCQAFGLHDPREPESCIPGIPWVQHRTPHFAMNSTTYPSSARTDLVGQAKQVWHECLDNSMLSGAQWKATPVLIITIRCTYETYRLHDGLLTGIRRGRMNFVKHPDHSPRLLVEFTYLLLDILRKASHVTTDSDNLVNRCRPLESWHRDLIAR